MPFIDKTSILVEDSNNNLILFTFDKDMVYANIGSDLSKKNSFKIIDGEYSFVDIWLDINESDTIYGIINDKKGKLLSLNIKENIISSNTIIKYDYNNFIIKFVYIKNILNESHIVYYSINKKMPYSAYLIHIYKSNDIYKKSRIDFIDYDIMTNFVVTFHNNTPTIFYFKFVDGIEELFISTFDLIYLNWSKPKQITNSKKTKMYLSVIRDDPNTYHIVFSERNDTRYFCKYLSGNLVNKDFIIFSQKVINKNPMCLFPHLIKYDSTIYIQWVEYFQLYSSQSYDLGKTWTNPVPNKFTSDLLFLRYEFRFNNNFYNCSTVFGLNDGKIIL